MAESSQEVERRLGELETIGEELAAQRRALASERSRRVAAETLVAGLVDVSAAMSQVDLSEKMVALVGDLVGAQETVLFAGQAGGDLLAIKRSQEKHPSRSWVWHYDEFVARVLAGRVTLVARPDLHPSWVAQNNPPLNMDVGSALHLGLATDDAQAVMIVCVHEARGVFGDEARRRGELLLAPLMQAWQRSAAADREARLRREAERANAALRRARDELVLAKEEAEAASRAKSAFLAHMSHELRTPLAGIIGATNLALADEMPQDARHLIALAHESGVHLLEILNDVLDLSKIEADKIDVEEIAIDVAEIVREAGDLSRVGAQEKGLVLDVVVELGEAWRLGDPLRIKQVLLNLLSNAVKFTKEGSVTLRVWAEEDDWVLFEVADTGLGIPKAKIETIFDSFRQGDESTGRRYGGTGLGLTICRRLVTLFGGELTVTSEEGKGSQFRFSARLPRVEGSWTETRPGESVGEGPRSPLRVLVVDDNSVNRLVAQKMLEKRGHHVVVAEDGQTALAVLQRGKTTEDLPELILMDIQMPAPDGLQTTASLRELPGCRDIPVIALTANVMSADREHYLAAGLDDYLTKPLRDRDLDAMIAKVLRGAFERRALASDGNPSS